MLIYIDIDNTICSTKTQDYDQATPLPDKIAIVNHLYEQGHTIVMWTARGTVTGIDHTDLTQKQLKTWGVKHHDLLFGKPAFDLLIDDKAINSLDILKITNGL